jgi:hypothetical protein
LCFRLPVHIKHHHSVQRIWLQQVMVEGNITHPKWVAFRYAMKEGLHTKHVTLQWTFCTGYLTCDWCFLHTLTHYQSEATYQMLLGGRNKNLF